MANKNKKFEFRVDEDFFNEMEAYKNKHHINWSSKIRAFIESEMANDESLIKEVKINPLLDRCCSVIDLFEFRFNTKKVVQQYCFPFDKNELGVGFQITILLDKETTKFLDDDEDYLEED